MKTSSPLRFSIIDYLNALPLNMAFKDGLFAGEAILSFDFPSQCADNLATRRADVGLISSIEYQRIGDLVIAPDVCIAARNEVRSVLILTKKPLADVQTVALDRFSRSSVALLKILFNRRFGRIPHFVSMTPDPASMLNQADAALIIGDAALALQPSDYQKIDLAGEWFSETGLPFVFAFWAMHDHVDMASAAAMVRQARDYGLPRIKDRMPDIQKRWPFPEEEIVTYFRENIHYDLGQEERESLTLFFRYAYETSLIPEPQPLRFAPGPIKDP